jgi:hypothetical protein
MANAATGLCLSDQLRLRKSTPPGFRDTYNLMIWKGLLKTRTDALI